MIDRWDRGATGEEAVGAALLPLEASGWSSLHDVVIGNIDHVVVGPGGLFTIETKSIRAGSGLLLSRGGY